MLKVDLWDASEKLAEFEIEVCYSAPGTPDEGPAIREGAEMLMQNAACAFARQLIVENEEANQNIGRASDCESHVMDDEGQIVFAALNHPQFAEATYPVEEVH